MSDREDKFLLTGAVLLTCDEEDNRLSDGALMIDGDEIADLGTTEDLQEKYPRLPRENLDGKLLMPGLVNTHIHCRMSIIRGLAEDLSLREWLEETYRFRQSYLDEETQKMGVELSLTESLKAGVTTIADMSFHQFLYSPITQKSGIRAVLYDAIMDVYEDTPRKDEIMEFLADSHPDHITPGAALHAPYSTTPQLLEWFQETIVEGTDVPYSIHLAEIKREIEECQEEYGMSPTEWLAEAGFLSPRLLAVHGIWLEDPDLELLRQNEVKLSHNPQSNMKLGAGVAPVMKMIKHGLVVGLGTDGAASNNDLDLFAEADTAGKLQKVHHKDPERLTARKLIRMLTIEGAQALNLEDQIGSIEVGKQADLITVDLQQPHLLPLYNLYSQLVYSVRGSDVRDVWIEGREIMRDRNLRTIDEDCLLERISRANHQINAQRKKEKDAIKGENI